MFDPLLRRPDVSLALGGRSRGSIYNDVRAELLTAPVKVGKNAVAWPSSEIGQIRAARIAGKSDDEVRELVKQLHEARKAQV